MEVLPEVLQNLTSSEDLQQGDHISELDVWISTESSLILSKNVNKTVVLGDVLSEKQTTQSVLLMSNARTLPFASDNILKVLTLAVIIVVGILGNGSVIYIITRERKLHRPPFYYLISFCVSDISRCIFCLPFVLESIALGSKWTHGSVSCTLIAFANTFFIFSSVMALLAIAVDRHLSIVYAHFHKRRSRGLLNLAVVAMGWLVSFAVSFPPIFGMGTYEFIPEESQCAFQHKRYNKNDTLGFLIVFTGVMASTIFVYIRIFIFLRNHRKMRPLQQEPARSNNWTFFGPGANNQMMINWMNGLPLAPPNQVPTIMQNLNRSSGRVRNLRFRKNEHLSRLFFIVTVVFDILWILYLLQAFVIVFGSDDLLPSTFLSVSAWLTYFQVALCPLIYVCFDNPFRKAMKAGNNAYFRRDSINLE